MGQIFNISSLYYSSISNCLADISSISIIIRRIVLRKSWIIIVREFSSWITISKKHDNLRAINPVGLLIRSNIGLVNVSVIQNFIS